MPTKEPRITFIPPASCRDALATLADTERRTAASMVAVLVEEAIKARIDRARKEVPRG